MAHCVAGRAGGRLITLSEHHPATEPGQVHRHRRQRDSITIRPRSRRSRRPISPTPPQQPAKPVTDRHKDHPREPHYQPGPHPTRDKSPNRTKASRGRHPHDQRNPEPSEIRQDFQTEHPHGAGTPTSYLAHLLQRVCGVRSGCASEARTTTNPYQPQRLSPVDLLTTDLVRVGFLASFYVPHRVASAKSPADSSLSTMQRTAEGVAPPTVLRYLISRIVSHMLSAMAAGPPLWALDGVKRKTSVEQVSEALQRAISTGELQPGQKLVLAGLAEALGISVTPVREALRQLQREGLVVDSPYAGMRVSPLSLDELIDLFEIRGVLDGLATIRSLGRIGPAELERAGKLITEMDATIVGGDADRFMDLNSEFHATFITRGAPPGGTLSRTLEQVQLRTRRYASAARHALPPDALRASNAEHRKILERVAAGDVDGLERLCRQHAKSFSQNLARALDFDYAG
jgi:DNA-binding GntR family transcriptional regulator